MERCGARRDPELEVETAPATDHTQSNVVPLHRVPASGGMSGFGRGLFAAAAAVVLLAGVGIAGTAGTAHGWWGADSVTQTGPNTGHSDSEHAAGPGGDPLQGAEAEEHMHSIMAMDDVRSVSLTADGSTLDVVVSSAMDSGGAMVNGAPALKDGMGAQVWSIDKAGTARSAGVIGQDPHENVWMPLPADTMTVRVTEEPMAGSEQPSGTVLAEGAL